MKRNISTVALISCLLITTCLAGCLEDDDADKTKPDFYGEVYWSEDGEYAYIFEEDGVTVGLPKINDDCEIYEDEIDIQDSSGDLCLFKMDVDDYSSEDEGDYYEICVKENEDVDTDCIEVYPFSNGIVIKDIDECEIMISDISNPSFDGEGELIEEWNYNWWNEFDDVYDEADDSTCLFAQFLADSTTGGGLVMYLFDGRDAAGTLTDGMGEDLVHIKMTDGEPLSWAVLRIRIVVDGGPLMTCDELDKADNYSSCTYDFDRSDNNWDIAEEITIAEGNESDLCQGQQGCDVTVTIIKIGVGGDDDKVLADIDVMAD